MSRRCRPNEMSKLPFGGERVGIVEEDEPDRVVTMVSRYTTLQLAGQRT